MTIDPIPGDGNATNRLEKGQPDDLCVITTETREMVERESGNRRTRFLFYLVKMLGNSKARNVDCDALDVK